MPGMSQFIHLQVHTEYSLLESPLKISRLLDTCKQLNMNAVAMTDNGSMHGVIEFFSAAKSKGIKPIVGCEIYLTPDMTVKERAWNRLVLLSKNYIGYQNLIRLVTAGHLDGFYYRPRVDLAALSRYSEGIIAISPGLNGPVGAELRSNRTETAQNVAGSLKEIYRDGFYLGLQKVDQPYEDLVNSESLQLSKDFGIPVVATNDVYYSTQQRARLRSILRCIQMGKKIEEETRLKFQSEELYLKSSEQMTALFKDCPEAIENTLAIADQCNLDLVMEQVKLPHFECPDNQTPEDYLKALVIEGIQKKYGKSTDELNARMEFELNTINKMNYAGYFLIIYDFLSFARSQGIPIGPGRGSAAGSIVAYALDITKVDPIRYHLLFERFLNPERISMPDVDLDFCIRRRSEVIDYIVKKYGEDRVSQIITFGTMASRGVIRDVGRVLDVPLHEVDLIAKLIPSSPGVYTSLPEALEQVAELAKLYKQSEEVRQLIDTGIELEGISRHTSTHAAGIVIAADPLTSVVPLIKNEGQIVTQFQMTDLEKIGLLKMDILGLRNLTVIDDALKLIRDRHGIQLDLDNLPIDDKKTYQLLCTGQTAGIFQLESRGMRTLIKDLKPQVFEDIIALLALYRPGPLGSGMVNEFISNKSGKTNVHYDLPELEPILKETYGLIVYQEQVMQIASVIAGFTLGQADMLRRAMGKKKKEEMDKMRQIFMEGAKKKNFPEKEAQKIFDLCYKFAEYGFNKSHSAAYALISFQTAYLKANYPIEYMTALLSSVLGTADKTSLYIQECQYLKIAIMPPDVNESKSDFTIVESGVRFGLAAVKNVGEGAIESIITHQPYTSIMDLCLRADLRQVNKRVIESLIKSGAVDRFGDRSLLLSIYERVLERAQSLVRERANGQVSMFAQLGTLEGTNTSDLQSEPYMHISAQEKLKMEKEMLGLYISGHPLDEFKDKLQSLTHNSETLSAKDENQYVTVGGILTGCRRVITRTKREMLVGTLEDLKGSLQVLMFQSEKFEEAAGMFQDDNLVLIKGRVRVNNDEITVSCDELQLIDKARKHQTLHIDLENVEDLFLMEEIKKISQQFRGRIPLYLHHGDSRVLAHQKYWISEDMLCVNQIENLVGANRVWRE